MFSLGYSSIVSPSANGSIALLLNCSAMHHIIMVSD